ncbi:MFS transporter [Piscinibacter sakaiensis]|uniref:MFS transporter n=1 Tax=Piscinibacter sakaiensis TaxID=1547922 RepID=UPI003AAD57B9
MTAALPAEAPLAGRLASTRWALLFGNFAIGCGVMVVAGSLNDLVRSLQVSVALGGQLIAIGAAVMCFAAPLLAGWVSGFDRRRLLSFALLWFAIGHAASALMPDYAALLPVRGLSVLGAAVFTPQAAAAVAFMAPPAERGRAITFIFLGWSAASVLGMPMAAWLGASFGWRSAFLAVALLALIGAIWVAVVMPDGVKPAALSLAAWKGVFAHPLLMAMVGVTALLSAGQFALLSFIAPYARQVLHASPLELSGLFGWFGLLGLIGTLLLSRHIDQIGAGRAATLAMLLTATTLLFWPLADGVTIAALLMIPWALAMFAANSAQQARLNEAAPAWAAALLALNSSAIYFGQAVGSSSGGWLVEHAGYAALSWFGLCFVLAAIAVSVWVNRRIAPRLA